MKRTILVSAVAALALLSAPSCKSLAKAAAKHWAKKKQKEFVAKCNNMVANKPGIKGDQFCGCVLDFVMEAYPDPDKGMQIGLLELLDMGKDCLKGGQ
jgi:hypothetical protein